MITILEITFFFSRKVLQLHERAEIAVFFSFSFVDRKFRDVDIIFREVVSYLGLAIISKQTNIGSSKILYWLLFNGSGVNDLSQRGKNLVCFV